MLILSENDIKLLITRMKEHYRRQLTNIFPYWLYVYEDDSEIGYTDWDISTSSMFGEYTKITNYVAKYQWNDSLRVYELQPIRNQKYQNFPKIIDYWKD